MLATTKFAVSARRHRHHDLLANVVPGMKPPAPRNFRKCSGCISAQGGSQVRSSAAAAFFAEFHTRGTHQLADAVVSIEPWVIACRGARAQQRPQEICGVGVVVAFGNATCGQIASAVVQAHARHDVTDHGVPEIGPRGIAVILGAGSSVFAVVFLLSAGLFKPELLD